MADVDIGTQVITAGTEDGDGGVVASIRGGFFRRPFSLFRSHFLDLVPGLVSGSAGTPDGGRGADRVLGGLEPSVYAKARSVDILGSE